MSNIIKIIKKKIIFLKTNIIRFYNFIIEDNIKHCLNKLSKYFCNKKKILVYMLILPIVFIICYISLTFYFINIILYNFIFIYKIFKNKKSKNKFDFIVYKKFIILENKFIFNIIIDFLYYFPKQKAFYNFYNIWKNILIKNNKKFDMSIFFIILKKLFNRYLIKLIFQIPFKLINYTRICTDKIWQIKSINHKNFYSLINTILMNIWFQLIPNENDIIKKLKIKFKGDNLIEFNPIKIIKVDSKDSDILKFNFSFFKENINIGFVSHKTEINENTGYYKTSTKHITAYLEQEDKFLNDLKREIPHLNETTKIKLTKYTDIPINTVFKHEGTLNPNQDTYLLGPGISSVDKMVFDTNTENACFLKKLIENRVNNLVLGFMLSLYENIYQYEYIKNENNIKQLRIKKEENTKLKNFLENNKEKYNNEFLEKMEETSDILLKNKYIIENMTEEEKNKFLISIKFGTNVKSILNFFILKKEE